MNSENQLPQSIFWLALIIGALLLIPLIAMQLTNEIVWTPGDFIFAGTLIFGTGLMYKLVTKESEKPAYRAAVGSALATGFILIWVNGAVGIIGSENNAINLLYFGVIAVGLIGTFTTRFQPNGMALTCLATALSQILVCVIALIVGAQEYPGSSATEIIGVNGFFIVLWIVSALLFRYATGKNGEADLKTANT